MHKVKISVLWIFAVLSDVIAILLYIMEPGILQQFISGEVEGEKITPEYLLLGATILLIMLVMAFLSVTLKDRVNRWANIAAGIAYFVLYLGDLVTSLTQLRAYRILLTGSGIIVYALIIWYAYKWPKLKE